MNAKMVRIEDIIILGDEYYPRKGVNMEWVNHLLLTLENLPLITINQENKLIKGRHRLKAHELAGKKEIECIIEKTDDDWDLYLKATEDNALSGLPYTFKERKMNGIRMFMHGMESKDISKRLGVSVDTVNKWVHDIREERDKQLEEEIIQTFLNAELTQSDVAKKFNTVNSKVSELKSKISSEIKLLIAKKDQATGELKEKYEDIYNFAPYNSDIWNVFEIHDYTNEMMRNDEAFSKNLFHHFTEPFDVVLTNNTETINACKRWLRRYLRDINVGAKPNIAIIDGNTSEYESVVKDIKQKMKNDGYIIVIAKTSDDDTKILSIMSKLNFILKNRIILPIPEQPESEELHHSYESLLLFSQK